MLHSSAIYIDTFCVHADKQINHLCITSKTSLLDFGQNVDQLITYAVRSNPSRALVEVLEVFHLTRHSQQVVCEANGQSVAFVQQVIQGLKREQYASRERPCFGIWVHKLCVPPTLNVPLGD